jgi:hypothetical protein
VSKVSQTPKYLSLPQKFQCQKTVIFAAYVYNLEIYLIDDSQRQHNENDQKR